MVKFLLFLFLSTSVAIWVRPAPYDFTKESVLRIVVCQLQEDLITEFTKCEAHGDWADVYGSEITELPDHSVSFTTPEFIRQNSTDPLLLEFHILVHLEQVRLARVVLRIDEFNLQTPTLKVDTTVGWGILGGLIVSVLFVLIVGGAVCVLRHSENREYNGAIPLSRRGSH